MSDGTATYYCAECDETFHTDAATVKQEREAHLATHQSDYTGKKPSSADRVSDRLIELTAERDLALQTARETYAALATAEGENEALRASIDRKLAEARKPYADKIMDLERRLAERRQMSEALEQENKALTYQRDIAREALADTERALEHTEAQLVTALHERDAYHDRIIKARAKLDPDAPA